MTKTMCDDCGETEFTIYNNDKGILCCRECGQFKEIAKTLIKKTEPVDEVPCSALLSTLSEILNICETTGELNATHSHKEAMNCDAALTEIMDRCREALKKDK